MHQDHKKISIVLTTYGDDGNLSQVLSSINDQTQPPDEVVIINCLHSAKIEKTIKLFKNLKIQYFYFNERLYPGGARNEGVRKSQYPYLAFLDSKTIPEVNWLENALKELVDSDKFLFMD
jgi:glycosyltransferase involved in cell wall biosynthesis